MVSLQEALHSLNPPQSLQLNLSHLRALLHPLHHQLLSLQYLNVHQKAIVRLSRPLNLGVLPNLVHHLI